MSHAGLPSNANTSSDASLCADVLKLCASQSPIDHTIHEFIALICAEWDWPFGCLQFMPASEFSKHCRFLPEKLYFMNKNCFTNRLEYQNDLQLIIDRLKVCSEKQELMKKAYENGFLLGDFFIESKSQPGKDLDTFIVSPVDLGGEVIAQLWFVFQCGNQAEQDRLSLLRCLLGCLEKHMEKNAKNLAVKPSSTCLDMSDETIINMLKSSGSKKLNQEFKRIFSTVESFRIFAEQKFSCLSERETDCIYYLIKGCSAKETARMLFLSDRTVETHFEHVKQKLGIHKKIEIFHFLFE